MNILFIGDVFSSSGREIINLKLKDLVKKYKVDFIIANGENISHGKGINNNHYNFLKEQGINVITSGNHIFRQKDTCNFINEVDDLLRPHNMSSYLPGKGSYLYNCNNKKIRVTNLMGRMFMDPVNNPYESLDSILENDNSDIHIVDFHAEATAEKAAFAFNYDGKITALLGTHTHVQTADEQILEKGTAFITDVGMTGPLNSIIGVNPDEVILKEKTGLQAKFIPSSNSGQLCGVLLKISSNNKVEEIIRIKEK
ncbi:putative metallophosphatase [Spiroplasma corruscae]|uniref:Putative metallophosphatase n=1 Tax=Spiroplasma corruscae TaxID=216934 RepID=A0A222EN95_9MOLU|nr:TIGR00282 family metallophosphoesterase [Spiroplasma corruscae]ASP27972.1 putative metallophosphatase [Spiroplasma corruscae]